VTRRLAHSLADALDASEAAAARWMRGVSPGELIAGFLIVIGGAYAVGFCTL
jgi:hypothetical protein